SSWPGIPCPASTSSLTGKGLNQMRRPLVAGNWKMHRTPSEASRLDGELVQALDGRASRGSVEVVICPPLPSLPAAAAQLGDSGVVLGAQDVHWEPEGAYIGEVSAAMLLELGCRYVIVGHSERRTYLGESDEQVARKVRAAQAAGLRPIVCVGE